jgi:hypothetical protein
MNAVMRRRSASFAAVAILVLFVTSRTTASAPPTITGEIVETYCWAKMRVGGVQHAACGIDCAKRGIPVAIVDARTRNAYVLLPGQDKRSVPPELIAQMGRSVTIRGEVVARAGAKFLTVQSWTPAASPALRK